MSSPLIWLRPWRGPKNHPRKQVPLHQKLCEKHLCYVTSKAEAFREHTPTTAYVKKHNASKLHCRLDCFIYWNLFQNEISHDFSSKSLVNQDTFKRTYFSLIVIPIPQKIGWFLVLEIGFGLFSSSFLLEPHGIVTFDLLAYVIKFILNLLIRLDIILIVYSHEYYLVVITTWLNR